MFAALLILGFTKFMQCFYCHHAAIQICGPITNITFTITAWAHGTEQLSNRGEGYAFLLTENTPPPNTPDKANNQFLISTIFQMKLHSFLVHPLFFFKKKRYFPCNVCVTSDNFRPVKHPHLFPPCKKIRFEALQ